MRREINILWVEDNLNARVKDLQSEVKSIIQDSLYEVNIYDAKEMQCFEFSNECRDCSQRENCNKAVLRDHRIDIIFSDNNLSVEEEGVDFLTRYRSNGNFKYYILYSNLDESDIVNKITDRLNNNKKVHLFSNFDFISLSNWEERIDEAIAAFLNNRNRMDELRNIYIVENSIIEDVLSDLYEGDYFNKINEYSSDQKLDNDTKGLWHSIRKDRNTLAHGTITFENGLNIAKNKGDFVSESEYKEKMEALKNLTDVLKSKDDIFNN